MNNFSAFQARHEQVLERIASACQEARRRPSEVKLMAVTKNHPPEAVSMAIRAKIALVGENRVQEAASKKPAVHGKIQWELIGHLQSNKTRLAATVFDRIQSVDSIKLLDRLESCATEQNRVLRILLQVNTGRDPAKHGCRPEGAPGLLEKALACPHLKVDGLMTIAPLDEDSSTATRAFSSLRELRDRLADEFKHPLTELSMGMSQDLVEAVRCGSTLVRIGTALFGPRAE